MLAMFAVVTGASGHLGGNLVRALLRRGDRVRALVHRDTRALQGLPVEQVTGDVLDTESLRRAFAGADVVFHLAGRISIVNWDREQVGAINIGGVKNVVAACKAGDVQRLVHVSSIHAHFCDPLNEELDETRAFADSARTCAPYDMSKAMGERIVRQAAEDGMNAVIVNPTGVIGPYDFQPSRFGATLLMMARGRLPAAVEGGFDWVDARDVAEGTIRASERAPSGGKYLLSGHWVSVRDVAGEVYHLTSRKSPPLTLPLWCAKCIAPVSMAFDRASGRRALFTTAALKALQSNRRISHARASRELGYQPRPFRDTIVDTLEWFRTSGYLEKV